MGKDIKALGEFGLIEKIRLAASGVPSGITGIGDDCAVIPRGDGRDSLISTDMLVEGTHFILEDISPRQLGWKTAAVNISDIAAMGGRPESTFLSLALPGHTSEEWMDSFLEGYTEISDIYRVALLGGDTTSSPDRMVLNVTVVGSCPSGNVKLRSSAAVGDLICVTGTLGDSAAGLGLVLHGLNRPGRNSALNDKLLEKHYMPRPRVEEGLILGQCSGVHAMMDISDGIGSDLRHILKASGVNAEIDTGLLPLSDELRTLCGIMPELDPVELACSGGEDYELLFTVTEEAEQDLNVAHTIVGKITERRDGNEEPKLVWKGCKRDFYGFRQF